MHPLRSILGRGAAGRQIGIFDPGLSPPRNPSRCPDMAFLRMPRTRFRFGVVRAVGAPQRAHCGCPTARSGTPGSRGAAPRGTRQGGSCQHRDEARKSATVHDTYAAQGLTGTLRRQVSPGLAWRPATGARLPGGLYGGSAGAGRRRADSSMAHPDCGGTGAAGRRLCGCPTRTVQGDGIAPLALRRRAAAPSACCMSYQAPTGKRDRGARGSVLRLPGHCSTPARLVAPKWRRLGTVQCGYLAPVPAATVRPLAISCPQPCHACTAG